MPDDLWRLPPFSIDALMLSLTEVIDWGLVSLAVPDAWKVTRGEGIKVAVLDTGIAAQHADLKDAIDDAEDFTSSRFGWNDQNGHGTHCAGIVAARQNDDGCVGVAPKSRLLVGKVLGDEGTGQSNWIVNGINWAIRRGADVISMSLGSPHPDAAIHAAIKQAIEAEVIVICAAGNSGPGRADDYPGAFPEVISVAATNKNKRVSRFSSRSPTVAIAAPGEQVTSCWHQTPLATLSGTSMATPFVAGICALALAKHAKHGGGTPLETQEEMREHLRRSATDIEEPGRDPSSGWGLVDPTKLLDWAPPVKPPDPPLVGPARVILSQALPAGIYLLTKEQTPMALAQLPSTLPLDDAKYLIEHVIGGGDKRQLIASAHAVAGFGLNFVVPASGQDVSAIASSGAYTAAAKNQLELLVGGQLTPSAFDWAALVPILLALIQQWLKK